MRKRGRERERRRREKRDRRDRKDRRYGREREEKKVGEELAVFQEVFLNELSPHRQSATYPLREELMPPLTSYLEHMQQINDCTIS